jgi:hypothetical protein
VRLSKIRSAPPGPCQGPRLLVAYLTEGLFPALVTNSDLSILSNPRCKLEQSGLSCPLKPL